MEESKNRIMKHKILDINEKNLVEELDKQYKLGYELLEVLSHKAPDAYSDGVTWKILFRSFKGR
jgi:hypothetical protein